MALQHRCHGGTLVRMKAAGIHVRQGLSMNDDLGRDVCIRFQQDRVEVDARCKACGVSLQRLGASDLATVLGHCAVKGHVLRLERRHRDTSPVKQTA